MLRISDWLRHSPEGASATDGTRATHLGTLAVLAAAFEASDTFEAPSISMAPLHDALHMLPPQFAGIRPDDPIGEWVTIAALAEVLQAPQLAELMLVELIVRLAPGRSGQAHGYAQAERAELAALCWARRGRVARTQGRFDDAECCYETALRTAGRIWRDARPHALVGLAALAANRGNIPTAERIALQVLQRGSRVFALYRVQAHQMVTYTMRRQGKLLDALLHGWRAFDLLDADDTRRDELLITMSEIAMAYGDLDSAARGFSTVRLATLPLRIRIPALVGTLDVAVRRMSEVNRPDAADGEAANASAARQSVLETRAPLLPYLEGPLSPSDRLLALIALGEAAMELGERDEAMVWTAQAAHIADLHGFHEKRFHIDSLRASIETGGRREVPTITNRVSSAPSVLRRFAALGDSKMMVMV